MLSVQDRKAFYLSGFFILSLTAISGIFMMLIFPPLLVPFIFIAFIIATGFTVIQPNEARVITFFGKYIGTIKESGFLFTIPFSSRTRVPLRLINFVTAHLKVNDLNGNPIEIGAVVVWRIADAAQASLNIDDYKHFVANQSDIAVRTLAAHYPYDSETDMSLRGNLEEIADQLKNALQSKLAFAGIVIEEARLSHLAYAPEVAAAMLKRQQAVAIFQARHYMAKNALEMIDDVIAHFEDKGNVKLSDDKKADLINGLLIVMTSDNEPNAVLNLAK